MMLESGLEPAGLLYLLSIWYLLHATPARPATPPSPVTTVPIPCQQLPSSNFVPASALLQYPYSHDTMTAERKIIIQHTSRMTSAIQCFSAQLAKSISLCTAITPNRKLNELIIKSGNKTVAAQSMISVVHQCHVLFFIECYITFFLAIAV